MLQPAPPPRSTGNDGIPTGTVAQLWKITLKISWQIDQLLLNNKNGSRQLENVVKGD